MLSLPALPVRALPLMTTSGRESMGFDIARWGSALPGSVAWTTANQARFVPFTIPEPVTIVKLLAYNGATANGTTDIGLFDTAGNAVISIAKATQAGTNDWQSFDVTDTPVVPGLYYVGLLNSGTTGTYFGWTFSKEFLRAMGMYSQAVGAADLPNPVTYAAADAAVLPVVGIALRTLI